MAPPQARLGRASRLVAALVAVALAGVLGVARGLRPDPSGLGTHTQLGLSPCVFLARTGRPCPACGLTTSAAWAVRGRLDRAWSANPAGCLLVPAGFVLVPWLLAAAATGRPPGTRSLEGPLVVLVVATVALGLAAWSIRIFLGRV